MTERSARRISRVASYRIWRSGPMKRASDIVISLLALIWLAPAFVLIAIWIKRDSPGPVFYRGTRMGRNGQPFKILKFRTMYETKASYSGPKLTARDDARVTPLGRWLRDTKLNELPQLWNVLVGDMSLVGPRPEDPDIVRSWPAVARVKILSVRPGITSPASVLYHNEEGLLTAANVFRQYVGELAPDKQRLDELYVRYHSFCLDMDTLLWTVYIILPRISSHEPPERLLFVGPVTRLMHRHINWFVADTLIALVAVGIVGVIWRIYEPLNVGWAKSFGAAVALALLFGITGALIGAHRVVWPKAAPEDAYDLVVAWAVAALLAFTGNLMLRLFPLGLIAISSVLALFGFVAFRYRGRLATGAISYITRRRVRALGATERVLIVGSGYTARQAAWVLDQPDNSQKFQVVGFVDDDVLEQGMRVHGVRVVGTRNDIPRLVPQLNIRVIILADRRITSEQQRSILKVCQSAKARLVVMPDIVDSLSRLCRGEPPARMPGSKPGDNADLDCLHCYARRSAPHLASMMQDANGVEVR